MCNVSWSLKDNIEQTFNLCKVVPAVLKQHCRRSCPVQCCPMSIKTTLNRIFLVQCCLEPHGQHYIGFPLCYVVPGVLRQHIQDFLLCNVVWSLRDNIARGFNQWFSTRFIPEVLKQHYRRFFVCAMLSIYNWDNIAQENYLHNVGPQCSDIVLQKNNLRNIVLNLP